MAPKMAHVFKRFIDFQRRGKVDLTLRE